MGVNARFLVLLNLALDSQRQVEDLFILILNINRQKHGVSLNENNPAFLKHDELNYVLCLKFDPVWLEGSRDF